MLAVPSRLCDMQGFPLAGQPVVVDRFGRPLTALAQQLHFRRDDVTFDGVQNAITIGGDPYESAIELVARSGTATRYILLSEVTIAGRGYTLSYTPANNDVVAVNFWSQLPVSAQTILGANDPYFSSVVSLLHMDGANGGSTFTDQIAARTWTASGATTSTTQKKFGTAAMSVTGTFASTQQYITSDTSADFTPGAGDFTCEGWFYCTSLPASSGNSQSLLDQRPLATAGNYINLSILNTAGVTNLDFFANSSHKITGTTAIVVNTWYHFAITRTSGTWRIFLAGNLEGSAVDATSYIGNFVRWGAASAANSGASARPFVGYMDDLRVTKGVSRYTATFIPQAYAFQNA